jgi:hypothetical protein
LIWREDDQKRNKERETGNRGWRRKEELKESSGLGSGSPISSTSRLFWRSWS